MFWWAVLFAEGVWVCLCIYALRKTGPTSRLLALAALGAGLSTLATVLLAISQRRG